ncbi:hypothetical protein Cgig2_007436 [Carnegiea gigantea]|uniref:EF-hand domain-containing protein n=1 Tax=Carnegiea gigantea TaxID=171969 RepID=A0A9Q1KZW7_9CARY|nr:hypothetical protein Cgig2_007436 [Carnegiea gigantea]
MNAIRSPRHMSVELLDAATILGFVEDEEAFTRWVMTRFAALDTNHDGFLSYGEMVEELKTLSAFDQTHMDPDPDEVARTLGSMFKQFDHDCNGVVDFEEFKEETKNIVLAMANGFGFLPLHVVLHEESFLFKAVEIERKANSTANPEVVAP